MLPLSSIQYPGSSICDTGAATIQIGGFSMAATAFEPVIIAFCCEY
jgi:hypothetical protein